MPRHFWIPVVLLLAAVMVACTSAPPPPPTIQPTYTPYPTLTPFPTLEPLATHTPYPTPESLPTHTPYPTPAPASQQWIYMKVGSTDTILLMGENLEDPPYYPTILHITCRENGKWDWYLSGHPIIREDPGKYWATFRIDGQDPLEVRMVVIEGFEGVTTQSGSRLQIDAIAEKMVSAKNNMMMEAWSTDQWDMRGVQDAAQKWLRNCMSP